MALKWTFRTPKRERSNQTRSQLKERVCVAYVAIERPCRLNLKDPTDDSNHSCLKTQLTAAKAENCIFNQYANQSSAWAEGQWWDQCMEGASEADGTRQRWDSRSISGETEIQNKVWERESERDVNVWGCSHLNVHEYVLGCFVNPDSICHAGNTH